MKELTWEDFYNSFYDWSEKTAAGNVKNLVSIGPANQVSEIILELYDYPKASNQLLKMAVEAELSMLFTDLVEMYDYCDAELLANAVTVCELDDRDSASLVDVLCMVEKGSLFDAIMNKARSCGVVFRASDLADLECALDITVSEPLMEESRFDVSSADDLLTLIWSLDHHPEQANKILRDAVERGISFDAFDLSQLPDYVDCELIKSAIKQADVAEVDAENLLTLMDDFCDDKDMIHCLIKKAVKAKKRFKISDLCTLDGACDAEYLLQLIRLSEIDDVDALVDLVPDELAISLCKAQGVKLPAYLIEEEEVFSSPCSCQTPSKQPAKGFLAGFLGGLFGGNAEIPHPDSGKGRNPRKKMHCTGDCANCPPHYGYRYGRWYYGRCHQYGCEFGGNRGDGAYD